MAENVTAAKVAALAKPICDRLGLSIWDVRYEKEGATWYLRVLIDKEGGVGIEDCEALHCPLGKLLDEKDIILRSYVLEVSSPGLGRELRRPEHFEACIGKKVRVKFFRLTEGVKEVVGPLVAYDKFGIIVETKIPARLRPFPWAIDGKYISSVRLADDEDLFKEADGD